MIIGPSGCGKTTLLKIIDGLIPSDGGQIFLDGKPISQPGPDRGVVFQEFRLFPWRRILENVEYGLEVQGVAKEERREIAKKYIKLVGLSGFEKHYPGELSGGMQQRVGLARALTLNPKILLMDEPFGSLDAQTRERLQDEILNIWSKTKKTIIFVTHGIDEAIYLADRILVLTCAPSQIKEIIKIDLPRPRNKYDVRALPKFSQYRKRLRKDLMS